MMTASTAEVAPRRPSFTLVEDIADAPRGGPLTTDERFSLAALQATTGELGTMAANAERTMAELVAGRAGAADAAVDAAIRTIPRWHFAMLNDRERNDAFALALARRVQRGSHVLDIGSGTGLLAMMALRAGAAHVTTCEANPLLAELTRQIVAAHGLSDEVTVVPKLSTELEIGRDLPAGADLIVSEIVDCGLIGEGVLPTLCHARRHLLARGGSLLPLSARLMGCLVESAAIRELNRVTSAGGYDVRLLNRFATRGHFPVRLSTWPHRLLAEPVELLAFDFQRDSLDDGGRRIRLPVEADGVSHGIVAWFELDLGAGVVPRNAPQDLKTHWMQAFIPWDEDVPLKAGRSLAVDLSWRCARLTARPAPTDAQHA